VLTKRGKHMGQDIPMCGVPVHAADDYLQKLIGLGFRVAVCEQIEDPAEAKKRGGKSVVARRRAAGDAGHDHRGKAALAFGIELS
jgi:DNA mismatch repair protein MutS